MSGVETLMWRLGRHDPRFRSTMSLLVTLDRPVRPAQVRHALAGVVAAVPRLADRVVEPVPATPGRAPVWEPDPGFGLENHLSVVPHAPAGEPAPRRRLVQTAAEAAEGVLAADFDPARPPWKAVLVGSPGSGGRVLILHLDHAYTDGLGGMKLITELFGFEPAPSAGRSATGRRPAAGHPPGAGPGPGPDVGGGAVADRAGTGAGGSAGNAVLEALAALVDEAAWPARAAASLLPWAARWAREATRRPAEVAAAVAEIADAVAGQARVAASAPSPVLARRSQRIRLAELAVPLDDLRDCGRRVGASVNDVFLAALSCGLGIYHRRLGSPATGLRMAMPVSTRSDDSESPVMANQFSATALRAPLGTDITFDERIRLVSEISRLARRQPWLGVVEDLARAAVRLPGGLDVVASAVGAFDVVASNVAGSPLPMYLGPARVSAMVPVGPRSGAAVNATLLSYCGRAHVGLNIDPVAVPDARLLVDCLGQGFAEVRRPAG